MTRNELVNFSDKTEKAVIANKNRVRKAESQKVYSVAQTRLPMTVTIYFGFYFFCVWMTVTAGIPSITRTSNSQETTCGNWVPYGNEKCVHIVDSAVFQTKQEAEVVCQSLADIMELDDIPRVITVRTEAEQKVLQQFLFEDIGILESVWLGLNKEDDGVFRWNNGPEMHFNYLAKQNVSDADRPCVQMESGQGIYPMGQWVRVNCRKRNVVVCEKIQVWTLAKLQNSFLNLKAKVERHESIHTKTSANQVNRQTKAVSLEKTQGVPRVSDDTSFCGAGWTSYKDEKCLMLVDESGTQTKEDAELICKSKSDVIDQIPKLVTIKTKDKQKFIHQLLFENRATFDNVWLGLEVTENTALKWNDGTEMFYSNWAKQNVDSERQCVQMESGEGTHEAGLWVRTYCKKRNAILCEKTQPWTVARLQNTLQTLNLKVDRNFKATEEMIAVTRNESDKKINAIGQEAETKINAVKHEAEQSRSTNKKEAENLINSIKLEAAKTINSIKNEAELMVNALKLEAETKIGDSKQEMIQRMNADKSEAAKQINSVKQSLEHMINDIKREASETINNIIRNPVPVGFIYIQIPGQQQPITLWPQCKWADVSNKYAGQFFRVVGDAAAPFGQIQDGAAPHLYQIEQTEGNHVRAQESNPVTVPGDGSWSRYLWDGQTGGNNIFMRFRLSKTEVRPRNQAIKVWQRVG